MASTDPRVDQYIGSAAPFARPILEHMRRVVHAGCPAVVETIKWSRPFFTLGGKPICNMAVFTGHCSFGLLEPEVAAAIAQRHGRADEGAGLFGRITQLSDLPDEATLLGYVQETVRLLESGKSARKVPARRAEIAAPPEFAALLKENPRAGEVFAAFTSTRRRDYLEWIADAKREATRAERMATAVRWIAEGKARNWKYEKR